MRMVLMFLFFLGLSAQAAPSRPVALVIGNGNYENVVPVSTAIRDAEAVAAALQHVGFEVKISINAGADALRSELVEFAAAANGTDTALIYYAGHGFTVDGKSYIVPSDAKLENASSLWFELISLDAILSSVQGSNGIKLVLIDAGTDHRFTQSLRKDATSVPPIPGLAPIEPPSGTSVVYSAKVGTSALRGNGNNSPFASAILGHIGNPGPDVRTFVERIKGDVRRLTGQAQTPQMFGSADGQFWAPQAGVSSTTQIPSQTPSADEAAQAWRLIRDTTDPTDIEAYLEVYGNSNKLYARLAQKRLVALVTEAAAPTAADSDQSGGTAPATPSAVARPDIDPSLQGAELVILIQVELNRLGCVAGKADGVWGRTSRNALRKFARHSGAVLAATEPSAILLRTMRATLSPICPVSCRVTENLINGRCIVKSCPAGKRLSSKGVCYTVKAKRRVVKCPRGQRLNSKGRCYTPRANRQVNRKAAGGGTARRVPRRARSKDPNVGRTPPAGSCIQNPPCRRDE